MRGVFLRDRVKGRSPFRRCSPRSVSHFPCSWVGGASRSLSLAWTPRFCRFPGTILLLKTDSCMSGEPCTLCLLASGRFYLTLNTLTRLFYLLRNFFCSPEHPLHLPKLISCFKDASLAPNAFIFLISLILVIENPWGRGAFPADPSPSWTLSSLGKQGTLPSSPAFHQASVLDWTSRTDYSSEHAT